jgi:hypothetical protein
LGAAGSVFLYTGVNTGGSGATGSLNFIVYYAGVSSLTQMTCTANGWALANGTVTLAATGTTTLTAAQKATPNLIMSTVTLTGGVTLALNGVVGTYDIDFGAVTVGAQTVTITNGAGSFTATTLLATKTLLHVVCNTSNTLAVG